jgi:hypothetical protein
MKLNRTDLIDVILDHQGKSDEQLAAALSKKLGVKPEVYVPFKHDANGLMEACGMESRTIDSTRIEKAMIAGDSNSKIVEAIENSYSKRELAYIVFSETVHKAKEQIGESSASSMKAEMKKIIDADPRFKEFLKAIMGGDK